MPKKLPTIVNVILDRSSSMEIMRDTAINLFNEYVDDLKKKKGKVQLTLTLFSSEGIETPYVAQPIKAVEHLSRQTYQPGGMTPLFDAVGKTLNEIEEEIEDEITQPNVFVTIITDGEENYSKNFNHKDIRKAVKELEKRGNWTFSFLATNFNAKEYVDTWAAGTKMASNTLSFANTREGFTNAFNSLRTVTDSALVASAEGKSYSASNIFDDKRTKKESS